MVTDFPVWTPPAFAAGAVVMMTTPFFIGNHLDFDTVLEESRELASLDSCSDNVDNPIYFTKVDGIFTAYAVNIKTVYGCERRRLEHNPLKLLGITVGENLVVTQEVGATPEIRVFLNKFKEKYHWLIALPPFPEAKYEIVLPAE